MNQSETIVSEENFNKMLICLLSYAYLLPIIPLHFLFLFLIMQFFEQLKSQNPHWDHYASLIIAILFVFPNQKIDMQCPKNVNNWCHESCLTLPSVGCILENKNLKVLKYHIHKIKIDCIERVKMQYIYGSTTHEYRF